jgi:DUF4097 and DUF4098 domain-containing protein YvlB
MRSRTSVRLAGLMVSSLAAMSVFPEASVAQDPEHDWSKVYQVSEKPALTLETGDAGVEIRSCGGCRTIHVSVHSDQKLSAYTLEERQEGNRVTFRLKEKPNYGFHLTWNNSRRTKVTVETPATLALDAKVADGSVDARGLSGEFQLRSSDGSVTLDDVHGEIHASTSDGSVNIHHSSGQLEARSSDGSVDVEGKYDKVTMRTSDGSVRLALAEGSQLTQPSDVSSSDGGVSIRLPHSLNADLDIRASDGSITCDLPLKLDGYTTKDSSAHHISGHLNGGGVHLSVSTSDGSVKIGAL